MLILGIDPGLSTTGYGLVLLSGDRPQAVAYGTLNAQRRRPLPERLRQIYDGIAGVIADWQPAEVAVEDFLVGNVRAAVAIGEARAVVLLAAAQAELPLFQYQPAQIKQFVTSYGGSQKVQVQEMVRLLLGLDEAPQPADAADALAVALCHCAQRRHELLERSSG
ncbi:MAG: crossover junction endodeoxyribonuclease RuvC [Dehalococcoidia bacterium]|nr:MAG: crossover junction endodeoxyribonuclease RuvC [Dehalococcoidia bacterium]